MTDETGVPPDDKSQKARKERLTCAVSGNDRPRKDLVALDAVRPSLADRIRHLHQKMDHLLSKQWQRLAEIQQLQLETLKPGRTASSASTLPSLAGLLAAITSLICCAETCHADSPLRAIAQADGEMPVSNKPQTAPADSIELQFRDSLLILPRSVVPDLPSNTGGRNSSGDNPRSKRFVIQKSVIIYPPRASVPVFSRYSYSPIVLSPTPVGGRMSQWPDAKRHPLTHSVAAIDASSALNLYEITDPAIKNHNGSKIEFLRSKSNQINASNSYSGVVQTSNDIEAAFRISIPAPNNLSDADELEFTVSAIKDIAGYVNSKLGK